jgi:hypothetical protein
MARKLARVVRFIGELALEVINQSADTAEQRKRSDGRTSPASTTSGMPRSIAALPDSLATQPSRAAVDASLQGRSSGGCPTCYGQRFVYRSCSACGGKGFHYTGVNYAGTASTTTPCGCSGGQIKATCPQCAGTGHRT